MLDFDLSKIAVVLIFLSILVATQVMVKRSKLFRVKMDKSNNSAIKIVNTVAVSKFSSATVIECAGSLFLVVSNRNGAPAIAELPILHLVFSLMASSAFGQDGSVLGMPALTSSIGENGESTYSLSLQILVLMTVLTVVPSIVLGMTAFTRVIIVLSILRQALGTQQTPPNQVLIAIALFITFYVMSPIFEVIYETALNPYLEGTKSAQLALASATDLLKEFMVANTRSDTMNMFAEMAGEGPFENTQAIPLSIVLPSFITSELKTAFEIGFLIFLPFLVIDIVIASILMSLGMMMLSPMLISLPFKLLLFVLVDGWAMTIGSLSSTFVVG